MPHRPRPWFAALIALLVTGLLAVPAPAAAAPDDEPAPAPSTSAEPKKAEGAARRPLLWMVEGSPRVFLYGTIHVPDPRVLQHLPVVQQALDQSTALYTELRMDMQGQMEMQQVAMTRGMLPMDKSLTALLGAETHAKVLPHLPSQLPPMIVDRLKPWIVNSMLLQKLLAKHTAKTRARLAAEAGESTGAAAGEAPAPSEEPSNDPLDKVLFTTAQAAGKEVGAMETVAVQFDAFDVLSLESQVKMIHETLKELEKLEAGDKDDDGDEADDDDEGDDDDGQDSLSRLLDLWLAGDTQGFVKFFEQDLRKLGDNQDAFVDALLDKRNVGMAAKVVELMKSGPKKTYFIAVGAAHMPGEKGIVKLLTDKGLKVRRIELGEKLSPVPAPAEPKPEPAGAGAGK
jgi:uncharacterized protein YbaP (TraB family)